MIVWKTAASLVAVALFAGSAGADAPEPGTTVEAIELVIDRSVIFRPVEEGFEILRVHENDRTVQLPRVEGEIAVAMSYNPEGGTMLEFNNGMIWNFDYELELKSPNGGGMAPPFPVCTVGSERVGVEHWPYRIEAMVFYNLHAVDGFTC